MMLFAYLHLLCCDTLHDVLRRRTFPPFLVLGCDRESLVMEVVMEKEADKFRQLMASSLLMLLSLVMALLSSLVIKATRIGGNSGVNDDERK